MPSPVYYLFAVYILRPASMYPPFDWEELYAKIEPHLQSPSTSELWQEMTDRYYASMNARAVSGDRNRLQWTIRDSWKPTITSAIWAHDRKVHEPYGPNSLAMGSEFGYLQFNVNRYMDKRIELEGRLMDTIPEEE